MSAAPFSWDVSGAATHTEREQDSEIDSSVFSASYYFGGVEDSGGPLALASFRHPTTSVSAAAGRERTALILPFAYVGGGGLPVAIPEFITDTGHYTVSGRYVLPRAKWYVGGHYTNDNIDQPSNSLNSADSKNKGLFGGRYLGANTTLEITLDREEATNETPGITCVQPVFCAAIAPQNTSITTQYAGLNVLHVRHFRALTYALSGAVNETSGDLVTHFGAIETPVFRPGIVLGPISAQTIEIGLPRFRTYAAAGEIFPTSNLGVRVGYSRWDGTVPTDDAVDIAATWFVTRNVGLRFSMVRQRLPQGAPNRNTDSTAVQITGRF